MDYRFAIDNSENGRPVCTILNQLHGQNEDVGGPYYLKLPYTLPPTAHQLYNPNSPGNLRYPLFRDLIVGWDLWTTLSSIKNQCQENTLKSAFEPKNLS